MRRGALRIALVCGSLSGLLPSLALAGGAWVPEPGSGFVDFGYSRKTANTSWDAFGKGFDNLTGPTDNRVAHNHDFRYAYLSGEVGLIQNLSATFLVTFLHGLEGPSADLEKNAGLSDAWFGVKYQLKHGAWPMALGFNVRTPFFYDIDGPYTRHFLNDAGEHVGNSPEWRGVLKHDFTLSYLASRSFSQGKGWANADVGYTFREGAPADHIPLNAEAGYELPVDFVRASVKGGVNFVRALGNDSERQPDDRFGSREDFNFNDASMARLSASLLVHGPAGLTFEAGYGQWVWGRSARQYKEPFFSVGRSF